MRIYLSVLIGLVCINTIGQIPEGYYSTATGLDGVELKDALYDIIKGHKEFYYTSSSTDTWDILKEADRDPNDPDNVILIYSGESVNAAQEYNNANGWTREHVWAKSRGDFGTDKGAGTDCHHLKPCSSSLNSSRSNRAFGEGGTQIWYNGSVTDNYSGVEYTFEPRDKVKGDVARMILYMATRYNGENGEPDLNLTEQVLGTTDKQPIHGMKSILLKWHTEDPVDDYERNRNEVVYSYQENRNPFIDHPEYVELIWGTQTGIGFQSIETSNYTYTVNDGLISLKSDNTFDKVEVYNLVGQKVGVYHGQNSKAMEINTTANGLLILLIDGKQTIKVIK